MKIATKRFVESRMAPKLHAGLIERRWKTKIFERVNNFEALKRVVAWNTGVSLIIKKYQSPWKKGWPLENFNFHLRSYRARLKTRDDKVADRAMNYALFPRECRKLMRAICVRGTPEPRDKTVQIFKAQRGKTGKHFCPNS